MSDETVAIGLRTGWVLERVMAKARNKSLRALRKERQLGSGPPWTKDGAQVLYNVEGYRQWLAAKVQRRSPGFAGVAVIV